MFLGLDITITDLVVSLSCRHRCAFGFHCPFVAAGSSGALAWCSWFSFWLSELAWPYCPCEVCILYAMGIDHCARA